MGQQEEGRGKPEYVTIRVRPIVAWFAQQMERKLSENDHKEYWGGLKLLPLWVEALDEMEELREEVVSFSRGASSAIAVVKEAADVANRVMMVADNAMRREKRR